MRYVFGLGLVLVALGVVRLVGCGDEGPKQCYEDQECDDGNQCTLDYCYFRGDAPVGYCAHSYGVPFCDFKGTDAFPVDGICEGGVCVYKEPECATDRDCEEDKNTCSEAACDLNRRDCIQTPANQGSSCCFHTEWICRPFPCMFDCCSTVCTLLGTCQHGECCEGVYCVGSVNNPVCVGKPDDTPCTSLDGSSGSCFNQRCCPGAPGFVQCDNP